jgi:hypothetical protein
MFNADPVTRSLFIYLTVSFIATLCLSLYYLVINRIGVTVEAFLFGSFYYFKFCWYLILWIIFQNVLMGHYKYNVLWALVCIGVIFNSVFLIAIWGESYFKETFFKTLFLINLLSFVFTFLSYKYVGPLYLESE